MEEQQTIIIKYNSFLLLRFEILTKNCDIYNVLGLEELSTLYMLELEEEFARRKLDFKKRS